MDNASTARHANLRDALSADLKLDEDGRAAIGEFLASGDEQALARAAKKPKKSPKFPFLKRFAAPTSREVWERCLRLLRAFLPEADVLAAILREADTTWLVALHRDVVGTAGEASAPWPVGKNLYDDKQAALLGLFSALRSDAKAFGMAFRAFDYNGPFRFQAYQLAAALGAEVTREGVGPRTREVRRVDSVVTIRKGSDNSIHVFESEEAAKTFVRELPPIDATPKKSKPTLQRNPGYVAIWVDTLLDPQGTLDGKAGPAGTFDHDDWEADGGPPEEVLRRLSHSASFAEAAIARAKELGADGGSRVDAIYNVYFTAPPGKNAKGKGWYLGSFKYEKSGG